CSVSVAWVFRLDQIAEFSTKEELKTRGTSGSQLLVSYQLTHRAHPNHLIVAFKLSLAICARMEPRSGYLSKFDRVIITRSYKWFPQCYLAEAEDLPAYLIEGKPSRGGEARIR